MEVKDGHCIFENGDNIPLTSIEYPIPSISQLPILGFDPTSTEGILLSDQDGREELKLWDDEVVNKHKYSNIFSLLTPSLLREFMGNNLKADFLVINEKVYRAHFQKVRIYKLYLGPDLNYVNVSGSENQIDNIIIDPRMCGNLECNNTTNILNMDDLHPSITLEIVDPEQNGGEILPF